MKIVFATDGSDAAAAAGKFLAHLPLPPGSAIQVICVASEPQFAVGPLGEPPLADWSAMEQLHESEVQYAHQTAEKAAQALAREGVTVTPAVHSGGAAHEILHAAAEAGADLLVVGSTGLTGLEAFLLGSVARNVVKHSERPAVVARAPRGGLQQVVLAVDHSEHSRHAVRFTAGLPLPEGATVTVAHIVGPSHGHPGLPALSHEGVRESLDTIHRHRVAEAEALVEGARAELAAAGKQATGAVREGHATEQLLQLADESGADLIIAGARGVSLIKGLLVGSVADRLLKTARCSVLLVH